MNIAIIRPKDENDAAVLRIQSNGVVFEEAIDAAGALVLSMALGDLAEEWYHTYRRESDAKILRTDEQKRELITWFISDEVKWADADMGYRLWLQRCAMDVMPDMPLVEIKADSVLGKIMSTLPQEHVVFTHFILISD